MERKAEVKKGIGREKERKEKGVRREREKVKKNEMS